MDTFNWYIQIMLIYPNLCSMPTWHFLLLDYFFTLPDLSSSLDPAQPSGLFKIVASNGTKYADIFRITEAFRLAVDVLPTWDVFRSPSTETRKLDWTTKRLFEWMRQNRRQIEVFFRCSCVCGFELPFAFVYERPNLFTRFSILFLWW